MSTSVPSPLAGRRLHREMFWPTLRALQLLGGSATKREVVAKAVELGDWTEEHQADLMPNGRTPRLAYYVGWALTRLKWADAITSDETARGVWTLSEAGRNATEDQEEELWTKAGAALRADRRARRADRSAADDEDGEPPLDEASGEAWKDALIAQMKALEAAGFERLCQRLLREAGFEKVQVTGRAGDGGIDGVGLIKVGLLSFPTYFQCKKYDGSVGASAVRDFRGAMAGRGEKGLLITTATFTPAARQEATRDGVPPIDLIDGDELCDLLKRHGVGVYVRERTVEDVSVDTAFWGTFE